MHAAVGWQENLEHLYCPYWTFTDMFYDVHCCIDDRLVGTVGSDHLNQWNQIGRIPEMGVDNAIFCFGFGSDLSNGHHRGVGGKDLGNSAAHKPTANHGDIFNSISRHN